MREIPVICLGGPTGSGKSEIALQVASELGCEIINTDSRQAYADFPIITAQPDLIDQKLIPHHLYGILEIEQKLDAGIWCEKARQTCEGILARNHIPLLVGGTGFYFKAFLNGLSNIPKIPGEISALFANLVATRGTNYWHNRLKRIDPEYASKIHPNDRQRVQRALEVYIATGKTLSWWHNSSEKFSQGTGTLYLLNPSLDELTPRLALRINKMVENGALLEAEKAKEKNPDNKMPGWSGIGCSELYKFLIGELDFNECKKQWHHNTRAYAKRQLTWFRAQKDVIIIQNASDILWHEKKKAKL